MSSVTLDREDVRHYLTHEQPEEEKARLEAWRDRTPAPTENEGSPTAEFPQLEAKPDREAVRKNATQELWRINHWCERLCNSAALTHQGDELTRRQNAIRECYEPSLQACRDILSGKADNSPQEGG